MKKDKDNSWMKPFTKGIWWDIIGTIIGAFLGVLFTNYFLL